MCFFKTSKTPWFTGCDVGAKIHLQGEGMRCDAMFFEVQDAVDGWNPANQLVVYPIIYKVLYILGG